MGCSASIDRAEPELHEPPQRPDRSQLPPAAAKPQLLGELDGNAHMLRLRSLYDDTQPRKSAGAVVQEPPAAATAAVVDVRRSRASVDQELCLAREAVAASTNVYGAADPETLNAKLRLADVLAAHGEVAQLAEAEALVHVVLMEARDACQEQAGPRAALVLNALQAEAAVLAAQGRHEEALAPAREALAGMLKTRGEDHARTARARAALSNILRATGRHKEADELRQHAPLRVRGSQTIIDIDQHGLLELNAKVNARVLHTAVQHVRDYGDEVGST